MQRHKQKIEDGETLRAGEEQIKQFSDATLVIQVTESGRRRVAVYLALPGDTHEGT